MEPGFYAQVKGHDPSEPEAAIDVSSHHIAWPVCAKVDARGADNADQEREDADQGIAEATRTPVGGEQIDQEAIKVEVPHDMPAWEAGFIDNFYHRN